ncbi:hypothetical protein Pcinc_022462 [Petrolisthes cinctipes]|uniref:Uncharacterized protein n=1 Tax=Petrolisthes cinctipes TaxID=88211 RepID=A0AAE1KH36_PETCI|nr:hypothetical protein Pcinc_022462 [Petrolisthes cinctipes]
MTKVSSKGGNRVTLLTCNLRHITTPRAGSATGVAQQPIDPSVIHYRHPSIPITNIHHALQSIWFLPKYQIICNTPRTQPNPTTSHFLYNQSTLPYADPSFVHATRHPGVKSQTSTSNLTRNLVSVPCSLLSQVGCN